jgi:AcrR family transcriptional regulator
MPPAETAPSPRRGARPARRRRTQRERREATRARLLAAAIRALVEIGYARTTTTEVCRRARVSQGALFLHFASKSELVAAAAERLFADLVDDYRARFAAIGPAADRCEAAVETLWQIFEQPRIHAAYELYVAARSDRELAVRLGPVAERHAANLRREAYAIFPEAAGAPRLDALIDVAVNAMQGATLGAAPSDGGRRMRALLVELVRDACGVATSNRSPA